jgi:anti-sigma factor ChrR (cupin superfamily)
MTRAKPDDLDLGPEERALASLDLAMPPVAPPAGLWARIDAALEGPAVSIQRFAEGRWRKMAPGVRAKRVWADTLLIECQPGASIPDHPHKSFEHAVVLSGDLVSDRATYLAGDYHGTPEGGSHEVWTTRTGCLVLVQYAA